MSPPLARADAMPASERMRRVMLEHEQREEVLITRAHQRRHRHFTPPGRLADQLSLSPCSSAMSGHRILGFVVLHSSEG